MVQNTTWNSVQKTCAAIGDALTPQSIDCLTADALEAHIRPCGFYKAKARTIIYAAIVCLQNIAGCVLLADLFYTAVPSYSDRAWHSIETKHLP